MAAPTAKETNEDAAAPAGEPRSSGLSPSYVYRVSLRTFAIDGVARVGMVPKYVAVTPDDRYVLVTNWCSYDLSVIDHSTFREVRRIRLGAYPRGMAIDHTSGIAYVAVMGSYDVARVDLSTFAVSWFRGVGNSPRHLILSTDGAAMIAVGFVVAFIAAMFVVRRLVDFVSRHGFGVFAWYRIVVGAIALIALTLAR